MERDRAAFAELSRRRGCPVVSATEAILESLRHVGARRVAVVSPYPAWLTEAALRYWRDAGIAVVEVAQVVQVGAQAATGSSDTRKVYNVTSANALVDARRLRCRDADAILLSGTGMPTLGAIGGISRAFGKPMLSSNLCLRWMLGAKLGPRGDPPWDDRAAWEALLDRL